MMWVFAIVLVLAMGGVAAVAAGRGLAMPEGTDDRVDTRLPVGDLSAADLRRVRLPLALRGYRMAEVDVLLDRLTAQIATQQMQLDLLTDRDRRDSEPPPARH